MENVILEICANSLSSALNAEKGGADRIELCVNLQAGGTTPSAGLIQLCRDKLQIPIHVLIRNRTGDFCYSKAELEVMSKDIAFCKRLGIDGIVSGCLNNDGRIDLQGTQVLLDESRGMSFTFHRAFDLCRDPLVAIQKLKALKVDRVLSSGQAKSAADGAETLQELVAIAGSRISIMPGGGINLENLNKIIATGAKEIHLSARVLKHSTFMPQHGKPSFSNTILENDYFETSTARVREIKRCLQL